MSNKVLSIEDFDRAADAQFVPEAFVAELLGVSLSTIRRRVKAGELPAPQKVCGLKRYQVGVVRNVILKSFDLMTLDDQNGGFDVPVGGAHVS